jgi:hypothetical protein
LDNPLAKATTEAALEFELVLKIGGEDGTVTEVGSVAIRRWGRIGA